MEQYHKSRAQHKIANYNEKVFVILPVHNRLNYTKKCLRSIKKQTYQNIKIILVDDGSTDKTFNYVKRNYPDSEIVKGTGNWWWTRSMYEGVTRALVQANKNDYILTTNNDCILHKNYILNMVEAASLHKKSIIGSLILDANKHSTVLDAGVKIDWDQGLMYGVAPNYSDNIKFYRDRKFLKEIDTLPGKGALIPITVFKKTGNFNYRLLPHYIGDYEFFCRAKRMGYRLVVSSDARLYNFFNATGIDHFKQDRVNYSTLFETLFSRKSRLNIVDHFVFTLLCCPREYLFKNLMRECLVFCHYMGSVFPFYHFSLVVYKARVTLHNIPIMFRQNGTIARFRLFLHNIPIMFRQNGTIARFRLFLYSNSLIKKKGKILRKTYLAPNKSSRRREEKLDQPVSYGYIRISKKEWKKITRAWLDKSLPRKQMNIVRLQLKENGPPGVAIPPIKIIKAINSRRLTLLDVGCSSGYYYDFFKKAGLDIDYQGCDISPSFIKLAKTLHKELKFRQGDIMHLPYKDNKFKIVLAAAVLYYAPNYKKALRELSRVSSSYILLHRLPVFDKNEHNKYFHKIGYGIKMPEMIFGPKELKNTFKSNNLIIRKYLKSESIDIGVPGVGKIHQGTILLEKQ